MAFRSSALSSRISESANTVISACVQCGRHCVSAATGSCKEFDAVRFMMNRNTSRPSGRNSFLPTPNQPLVRGFP